MTEPERHDKGGSTAILLVRLWWDEDGVPALRARVLAALGEPNGEVRDVLVAGRGQILETVGRMLAQFEEAAQRRVSGG